MVRHPHRGRYRRTRMFVLALSYRRKAVHLLTFHPALASDIYDPALSPLHRDRPARYGAVPLPCRVREDPRPVATAPLSEAPAPTGAAGAG